MKYLLHLQGLFIIQVAEPTSAAKMMIKNDNIESNVLISKVGDLLLQRRKQELPPSRGGWASSLYLII